MKTSKRETQENAKPGVKTEVRSRDLSTTEPSSPTEREVFERYAIFGSFEMRQTSRLRRGYITCFFGSGELDLREAEVAGELELDVRLLFGSLEVEVPSTWEVVIDVHPVFGSTELGGRSERAAHAPTLRVRGLCLFGSLEVKRKRV